MSGTPTPQRIINDAANQHREAWLAHFADPARVGRPDLLSAYRLHEGALDVQWQADLLRQLLVAELDVRRRQGQETPARGEYERVVDELAEVTDCRKIVDELVGGGGPPAPASSLALTAGSRVLGYVLEASLGAGSFGEVWRAKADSEFGFRAALKFIRLGQAVDAEARALAILKEVTHPYLVSTFRAERVSDCLVVAMELAEGSLADKLAAARAEGLAGIPFEALLDFLDGAAEALDHLNAPRHTLGDRTGMAVQHCDIKPENLLTFKNLDKAKVADFSTAQMREHTITSQKGGCTLAYAAPEFFDGKVTRFSDQYSLAVTYCMLRGGQLPFTGNKFQLRAGRHLGKPPDLAMLPTPEERQAVARALAKRPDARWPSCAAFLKALRGSAGDEPPAAAKPRAPRKKSRGAVPSGDSAASSTRRFAGHRSGVTKVLFLPDRSHLLTASLDKTVRLWDPRTGEELQRFEIGVPVRSIAYVARRGAFLTGGDDKTVRVWELATGRELSSIPVRCFGVLGLAVSPDGNQALYGGPHQSGVIDVLAGQHQRLLFDRICVTCIAFSPDGARALFGASSGGFSGKSEDTETLLLWDARTRAEVCRFKGVPGHQTNDVAFSPDGRYALAGTGSYSYEEGGRRVLDCTLRKWDLTTGQVVESLGDYKEEINAVAFSPDGRRALSGGADGVVRLWDTRTGRELCQFAGHTAEVNSVAFSPDGRQAGSAGADKTAWLWDLPPCPPLEEVGSDGHVGGQDLPVDAALTLARDSPAGGAKHPEGPPLPLAAGRASEPAVTADAAAQLEAAEKGLWNRLEAERLSGEDAWVAGHEALDHFRFHVTLDEHILFQFYKRVLSAVEAYHGVIWRDQPENWFSDPALQSQALSAFLYYNYSNCTNDFETICGAVHAAEVAKAKGNYTAFVNCLKRAAEKLAGAYGINGKRVETFSPIYERHALSRFLETTERCDGREYIPGYDALTTALRRRLKKVKAK